jgi:hypothetical protein
MVRKAEGRKEVIAMSFFQPKATKSTTKRIARSH